MEFAQTPEQCARWASQEQTSYEHRWTAELPEIIDAATAQPKPPIWYVEDVEESYRRGFAHAALYCSEAIGYLVRAKYVRPQEIANIIENWAVRELFPWKNRVLSNHDYSLGHPTIKQEPWDIIRIKVFSRDRWKCVQCGAFEVKFHCDHIISVANGGLPVMENLQTLCPECNFKKGSA